MLNIRGVERAMMLQVLELANSVAGPWGEEIIEAATQNKVASKSSSESVKCQSLLESLKNGFLAEIKAMEQDFKLQVNMQKGENVRFKQLLTDIRSEKTSIHQQLLLFQRRVERLENEIGQD
ncbi:hypothetical protein TGPRC2_283495 [Toxoplasma gondii TgCatPRC2]|uniref:Uncharacterized protein n=13 Tax=Toxoplasma gondii TaxID=5811 RepID=A0A125YVC8_TOXGV|nr:hypothetical protein TGME49_283495 [Toxoplasma gondii ME49]EPR59275.1 hypothetical protein TGGT1_283495 [Toxoplasma gondii GT1]ESS30517.1 hypothetical protein TGVEG_283495 [Toxoplasma gondii VEG]KAF4643978.1 hypothetical protein TGRH88_027340 [Toxoplasma gondii]KFG28209.1 hypothetical protein TGP89_283495 [Toxoplasma gondii p89]KFG30096.1 hypothetical protein TGDOM2_283495 [Toxoplasma gondii GAB2-2007-GAL-DOM2]KFG33512.1 hypothetical protein TGFOU_283495 [Toxoplasma gondii FOU]KFG63444.1 |eukprot:XP_018637754.1 hypothetical protein TGME49_283495 [Toxoplasma gondii ME49]